jgi:hypothetical protein
MIGKSILTVSLAGVERAWPRRRGRESLIIWQPEMLPVALGGLRSSLIYSGTTAALADAMENVGKPRP